MKTLKWTKNHTSTDGRFWLYKAPRSDSWEIFDSGQKDARNCSKRCGKYRLLADAKEACQRIADAQPTGKPLIDIL